MEHDKLYAGLDIGGTKCAVVIADHTGTILASEKVATDHNVAPQRTIRNLCSIALGLAHSVQHSLRPDGDTPNSDSALVAAGITCGGPLDSEEGVILSPPNLPGWDAVPIVDLVQRALGVPTGLQNDANACALAEWRFGAARGYRNVVFLTFGTGMGAGLILEGRLYSGTNDMAGEIGHVRMERTGPVGYGKAGSFEGFCSGAGIAMLARERISAEWQHGRAVSFCRNEGERVSLTTKAVGQAALAGDPLALAIIETSAEYLGRGLAMLIDIINPEIIVIGSIFARLESLFRGPVNELLCQESIERARSVCRVVPAALGEKVSSLAAVSVAMEAANVTDSISGAPPLTPVFADPGVSHRVLRPNADDKGAGL